MTPGDTAKEGGREGGEALSTPVKKRRRCHGRTGKDFCLESYEKGEEGA